MNKTIPLLIMIALFGAAGWYFFTARPSAVHELPPPAVAPVEQPAAAPEPAAAEPAAAEEVPAATPLPELEASDDAVKQALDDISGDASVSAFVVKNNVISRLVAAVDSLTGRQVPRGVNPLRAVDGSFEVENEGDRIVMSPANFARYSGYVDALQEMDSGKLVAFYHRYYPLIQRAWEENGGDGSFDARLLEVIDSLLQTPEVTEPVYLVKPEAVYVFEDPELEALTAGQKILIRMGGANAAIVKDKLEAFSRDLQRDASPE